ncbi:hypothetical protein [Thermococcus aciditolerans]|uniref:Uncharacterized protein n=1 Tax=Thermococcus aciditolerans TaxID=2598455 RepID=A0A5C0SID0_9EURY|nr:hypothetical protein [Thermococcus aciditolerans]QEK13970.1 hypothetical protein FPV09_01240 [Thermococcus aciditolerans]
MKLVSKVVSAVLLTALLLVILVSAVQWVAFENARERVLSLPCNLSPAPYRLEVESFLPPGKLIDDAVGHRYRFGELEVVVPGKLGGMYPYYGHLLWHLSWELNDSVAYLRGFLANGSDEEVEMAFQVVERHYFMLRLEEKNCRKNLTAVIFRPAPPLKWVLSLRSALEKLSEYRDFRAMLFGTAVAFSLVGIFWLWLFLVAKLPLKGPPRVIAALLLMVILFGSAIPALKLTYPNGENDHPTPAHPGCDVVHLEGCHSVLFHAALDYMGDDRRTATCETLAYLEKRLRKDEIERLAEVLEVDCP